MRHGKAPQSRPPPPKILALYDKHDNQKIYDDEETIIGHVQDFYTKLFGSSDLDIPSWVYDEAYDMEDYNILDGYFVTECARSMNKLKISAEDQVVAEHLMELDILHDNMIAYTVRRIICNKEKSLSLGIWFGVHVLRNANYQLTYNNIGLLQSSPSCNSCFLAL